MPRIACRAVFLDAGGVIVLPDRHLLAGALARAGIVIDPDAVPRAHYRAVRTLDHATATATATATVTATTSATAAASASATPTATPDYAAALFPQLGILPGQAAEARRVWERLADRRHTGQVLWREPVAGAHALIDALRRAGISVVIVTNSDGHAEENLRASGFDNIPVIDSTIVGAAKPDPRIFEIALTRAGIAAADAVHIGDTLTTDIAGAHAAGIVPIHLDPLRACRATDHRHIRTLAGVWHHIAPGHTGARPGAVASVRGQRPDSDR